MTEPGPGYFYTIELPERYGKLLERAVALAGGLFDPEEMAKRLLCDALDEHDARYPENNDGWQGPPKPPPPELDDDIPF